MSTKIGTEDTRYKCELIIHLISHLNIMAKTVKTGPKKRSNVYSDIGHNPRELGGTVCVIGVILNCVCADCD